MKRATRRRVYKKPVQALRLDKDFDALMTAIQIVAPMVNFCFWEETSHCFEMSWAIALFLKERGFEAEAIPCALMGGSLHDKFSVGHTTESLKQATNHLWSIPVLESGYPIYHMVVRARHAKQTLWLDPTTSQISKSGCRVPMSFSWRGDSWWEGPFNEDLWVKYQPYHDLEGFNAWRRSEGLNDEALRSHPGILEPKKDLQKMLARLGDFPTVDLFFQGHLVSKNASNGALDALAKAKGEYERCVR